jgi:hypothetical protein
MMRAHSTTPSGPRAQPPWVEHLRHFASGLIKALSIIEELLTHVFGALERILEGAERALIRVGLFGLAAYAIYSLLKRP